MFIVIYIFVKIKWSLKVALAHISLIGKSPAVLSICIEIFFNLNCTSSTLRNVSVIDKVEAEFSISLSFSCRLVKL